jgi:hypothetical protein
VHEPQSNVLAAVIRKNSVPEDFGPNSEDGEAGADIDRRVFTAKTSGREPPRAQLAAENLFLRRQSALYLERQVKPGRASNATRILVTLSRLIDWHQLLTVVKPETLIRWHRKGFRLF